MRSARRASTLCPRRQAMWPRAWARKVLPDADGPDDGDVVVGLEEAQGDELAPGARGRR